MTDHQDLIRENLLWTARDFTRILAQARSDELKAPSSGTRWTNRQLLFHMLLGQEITCTFLILIGGFSKLPPAASRSWSRLLGILTGPYNAINWAGAVFGGRVLTLARMQRMMDRATRRIIRWYENADGGDLARGMSVPASWDPYFKPWMNRRDLLAWAPQHYLHHRRQLTLTGIGAGNPGPD